MSYNDKPKIPTQEYKFVIKRSWYPNVPNTILQKDMVSILKKNNHRVRSHFIQSKDICDLFLIHGKPTIFDIEDYKKYLEIYS